MTEIREVGPEALERWAEVPIRFVVKARMVARRTEGGFGLAEVPVTPPYEYDYDALEPPVRWRLWDLSRWGFLRADGGAAAIAFRTPGLELLEGRADCAALWDIRVHPDRRGAGIGRALFRAACIWARRRGASTIRVETQDINVPACRFYQRQGCRLDVATPGAYEAQPDQVQLLWSLGLAKVAELEVGLPPVPE